MGTFRKAVLLAVTLCVAMSARSELPPEMRRHHEVRTKDGALLYTLTAINRFSEQQTESIILVRDEAFLELVFRNVLSFEKQYAFSRISDRDDETYVQRSYDTNLGVKTWSEARELMHQHEAVRHADVVLKLETNGGASEYAEAESRDPMRMRELRHAVRSSLSPPLLEAIERMRGTLFGTSAGHEIYLFAGDLLYDVAPTELPTATNVMLVDAEPDCAFDKAFGYPCTESQLARIAKGKKEGKKLHAYW